MKINCLIIDDEPLAISILESYIKKLDNVCVVNTYTKATDALSDLEHEEIDVIFLDINMPHLSGLEFLGSMQKQPLVVITTAYREYALESYEFNVVDYLVKPIRLERFMKAVNKVSERLMARKHSTTGRREAENTYFFIRANKKMVKILFKDILFIESLKDYIKINTLSGHYIVYQSLSGIIAELPKCNFLRVHKSYVVAIDKVMSMERHNVEVGTKNIPIGRSYLKIAKERILADHVFNLKNENSNSI
ncbi:LytR/AlgR family response regulator transcription factor [Flagellimonas flava]|uniref:LytR/AlgR family response regulator transcription factor n=1 Tax=Flagellimonas flava TaxID=570519 RepID=UPI003D646471